MTRSLSTIAAAALLLASTPAFAWNWPEEQDNRIWRGPTLDWAQDIALDELDLQLSHQDLFEEYTPPPREQWCTENPAPSISDCEELNFRVRSWLRDFLEVPQGHPLPAGLPIMPAECQSICTQ